MSASTHYRRFIAVPRCFKQLIESAVSVRVPIFDEYVYKSTPGGILFFIALNF
jgi:hypothetical protein